MGGSGGRASSSHGCTRGSDCSPGAGMHRIHYPPHVSPPWAPDMSVPWILAVTAVAATTGMARLDLAAARVDVWDVWHVLWQRTIREAT